MNLVSRKNKLIICSILILAIFVSIYNVYARRTDKENFPVSKISDVFPESYKPYINELKKNHPNWVFKAVYTGLDWNDSVYHESFEANEGISLVPDSYASGWKKDGQDYYKDGNFVIASKKAVAYMLDPRTHLTEKEIFQFESVRYSANTSSKEAVEKVLYGTSMYQENRYKNNGKMITMDKQYSDIIVEVAKATGVSATFIASRIVQETGGDIIGYGSINGSFKGYEGYYNFFNIKSTPPNPITNGLKYAKNNGWTTPEISIRKGVEIIKKEWIDWGQYTTYFQKFDVNNEGKAVWLYGTQYMTNIIAPTSESISTYNAYQKIGHLNDAHEFFIPVYENMYDAPSHYPGTSFEDDGSLIKAANLNGGTLKIRSGASSNSSSITSVPEGTQMIRIGKSTIDQWDYVKLSNGMVGYVFRDYTTLVTGNIKVESISLNKNAVTLFPNEQYNLTATINPTNATNKGVTWKSSNESVATVDNTGKVTTKAIGSSKITATTADGNKTATCVVTVIQKTIPVTEVTLDKKEYSIKVGEQVQVIPTVKPDNATNKSYKFEIKDTSIIGYENNKIIGKKIGQTVIKFIVNDNNTKYVEATVKVVDVNSDNIVIDSSLNVDSTNTYISKINPGTTLKNFKDKILTNNTVTYIGKDGKTLTDESLVTTGTKVVIKDASQNVIKEYTLCIYGDISGDGVINSLDLSEIRLYMLEQKSLSGAFLRSADMSKDGSVNSLDLSKIRRHLLELENIIQ